MTAIDTGICVPESSETLLIQQHQLMSGSRIVQMFPTGTSEMKVPDGMARHENQRGVFHFNARKISPERIEDLSSQGRENEFLNLGPFSKYDIALRVQSGERVSCITEYDERGIEVRSAAGTDGTIPEQKAYFERTKMPNGSIIVGSLPPRVIARVEGR